MLYGPGDVLYQVAILNAMRCKAPGDPRHINRTWSALAEITKRTHGLRRCAKIRNEPKTRNSRRLEERFDIWPIFARARATGGMCSRDVMGNIGEILRQRDVNGCAALAKTSSFLRAAP